MSRAKDLMKKNSLRIKRKKRVRSKISGTEQTPRVSIFKSNKHIYAQAIDDVAGVTLAAVDGAKMGLSANKESAVKVATEFANTLKSKNIETVVFDKNGYLYHGVVAAFAQALRDNGIKL
jgi:large subunit ribosomal protein L18